MKNILIPTDYSANARNATEYALHLAKALGASVQLLHVFPAENNEAFSAGNTSEEVLNREREKLEEEARFFGKLNGMKIETMAYPGELHEVLSTLMLSHTADMVVVGMRGLSVIDKIFMGSTTTHLLKHADYPLLIVPAQCGFKALKNIAIGADFNTLLEDTSFSILKDLTGPFNGKTQIVHIDQAEDDLTEIVDKMDSKKYFDKAFEGIKHTYTAVEAENVVIGLVDFLKTKSSDMIVMVPQKHSLWQSVFLGSTTKKMLYQTEIPLLILPVFKN